MSDGWFGFSVGLVAMLVISIFYTSISELAKNVFNEKDKITSGRMFEINSKIYRCEEVIK